MTDPFETDPFADEAPAESTPEPSVWDEAPQTPTAVSPGGPVVQAKDNWVSFQFSSAVGYDRINATVHGEPQFVADLFSVPGFDGKISTLMKKSIKIDEKFKEWYAGGNPGKA